NVLLLLLHHIAGDESSLLPFAADFALAYTARCRGAAPDLPDLPVRYADFSRWQRGLLGSADDPASVIGPDLAFWTEVRHGLPGTLQLPVDRARPAVASYRGALAGFTIDAGLRAGLRSIAKRCNATTFMVLQAAVAALFTRLGAGTDIPLGVPVGERAEEALR